MMKKIDLKEAEKRAFRGKLGAIFSPEKTVFRFWQPFAKKAFLRLYNAENKQIFCVEMHRKNNIFEYEKRGNCEGFLYDFSVIEDGCERDFADIYACAVTADGTRGIVTNMRKNAPKGWENDKFLGKIEPEKAVIYEVSVRDFSMDKQAKFASHGKFLAFCEENVRNSYGDEIGLDYIKNLGVTHIQLMPIFDFDSDGREYNWGYNPRFYNAPSSNYSLNNAVLELREMVLSAHKKGLGVIADVVYNHVFSADNSSFEKQVPGYFFRGDGEFSNGSGCGNEFASERLMARKFILGSLEFITKEYHIDGLRFDLMGLLDVQTMRIIERNLRKINPAILLYGEGWTGGASPLSERLRAVQSNAKKLPEIAFFNDSFRDAVKGNVFDKNDCGFVNGKPDFTHFSSIFAAISGGFPENFWTKNPAQTINYVECHDNLTLFDKLKISLNNAGSERILAAEKMSAALIFLSNGIAFFQAGQEFLRSKNLSENSYNLPDKINSIKWNLLRKNREIVEYYRGLIGFRKRFFGVFRDCRFKQINENYLLEKGDFLMLINTKNEIFEPKICGNFEYYIDENRASAEPIYTKNRLYSADFGVVVARRICDEK